jgi:phage baseplate assembly protein W
VELAVTTSFLGTGWANPPSAGIDGEVATVSLEEDVRQAVRIILETNPGERVMRPDFGAGLNALVFEPINTTTMALAQHRVEQALILWEPRIDSITVFVTAEPTRGRLLLDIRYRIRSTNTFYNLVYPFYLSEAKRP